MSAIDPRLGRSRLARGLRAEQGMTVVEGAVAGLLVILGALAALMVFDASTRTAYRAEESQAINNRLQAELEEIRKAPYAKLALSSQPAGSADRTDPRWRVSGSSFALGKSGTDLAPLVVDSAKGQVDPGPEPFQVGDVNGEIFRFVVWRNDPSCPDSLCPGNEDLKRIVVAARVDDSAISTARPFHEVHGDAVDPDALPVDNPAPPGGGGGGGPPPPGGGDPPPGGGSNPTAELWLTDTPCSFSVRQPIVADHDAHNTRGICDDELKAGGTPGAPDLMAPTASELDPNYPPDAQPEFDYATDVEPSIDPDLDKGLLLRHPSAPGCLLTGDVLDLPLTESSRHHKVHKWLSPPIPVSFELLLLGTGTLELWTKTVNGAAHPGRICVWLFVRKLNLLGEPVDVPVLGLDGLPYFVHSMQSWPAVRTKVSVPLEFVAPGALVSGERIGLAITLERNGTDPGDGLELMYDHPSFGSRLQLQTDKLLPF